MLYISAVLKKNFSVIFSARNALEIQDYKQNLSVIVIIIIIIIIIIFLNFLHALFTPF
jgi:hypothetical protein